jgi:hypothetical protein
MSTSIPRLTLLLPVLLGLGASVAAADDGVCTMSPTATIALAARPAPPPGFPAGFVPNNAVTVTYGIGAQANPNVSCSNLTRSFGARVQLAGLVDDSPAMAGETESDTGSSLFTDLAAGTYRARVTTACACGILGGNEQSFFTTNVVVPPTIEVAPNADSEDHSNGSDITFSTIPKGSKATVIPVVESKLCTGETMTATLTGPGGLSLTKTATGNANCTGGLAFDLFTFTPTEVGALSLVAEYQGQKSNVMTGSVVEAKPATSPDDPTDPGTTTKTGCQAVDASALGLAGLALARVLRRRS